MVIESLFGNSVGGNYFSGEYYLLEILHFFYSLQGNEMLISFFFFFLTPRFALFFLLISNREFYYKE